MEDNANRCEICNRSFESAPELRRHEQENHSAQLGKRPSSGTRSESAGSDAEDTAA